MPDQPTLSPAQRVENALRSSRLRTENAGRFLANATHNLGVMQAESRAARARVDGRRATRQARIAAMPHVNDSARSMGEQDLCPVCSKLVAAGLPVMFDHGDVIHLDCYIESGRSVRPRPA
jgi:hypothetical protein